MAVEATGRSWPGPSDAASVTGSRLSRLGSVDSVTGRLVIEDLRPRTPTPGHFAKAVVGEPVRVARRGVQGRATTSWPAGSGCCRQGASGQPSESGGLARSRSGNDEVGGAPSMPGPHRGRTALRRRGLDRPVRHLGPQGAAKLDAGQAIDVEIARGPASCCSAGRPTDPCVAGGAPGPRRSAASTAALALGPALDAGGGRRPAGPWGRRRPRPTSAPAAAVGRPRAGPVRGLVRAVPPLLRRLEGAAAAAARTWPPWASTCSTCRRSTRSAAPPARARTTRSIAGADDPGSPWAIGSRDGGHTAIDPTSGPSRTSTLGRRGAGPRHGAGPRLRPAVLARPSLGHGAPRVVPPPPRRLDRLRREPAEEVPGHLPDQLLARQPRRDRVALWEACQEILEYWIGRASRIFRVDNPHTKPFAFWEWLIARDPATTTPRCLPGRGVHPARR